MVWFVARAVLWRRRRQVFEMADPPVPQHGGPRDSHGRQRGRAAFTVRSPLVTLSVALATTLLALGAQGATDAAARPCADSTAVLVRGIAYIVYTGDGPYEAANLSCRKARRIAKEAIRGKRVSGWRCKQRSRPDGSAGRCVRGGTYTDGYGNTQWRYLIAWYPYVPH